MEFLWQTLIPREIIFKSILIVLRHNHGQLLYFVQAEILILLNSTESFIGVI